MVTDVNCGHMLTVFKNINIITLFWRTLQNKTKLILLLLIHCDHSACAEVFYESWNTLQDPTVSDWCWPINTRWLLITFSTILASISSPRFKCSSCIVTVSSLSCVTMTTSFFLVSRMLAMTSWKQWEKILLFLATGHCGYCFWPLVTVSTAIALW